MEVTIDESGAAGQEDHIGAVPFLVDRLPLPIHGMPLPLLHRALLPTCGNVRAA
jgi:hypothetical protein